MQNLQLRKRVPNENKLLFLGVSELLLPIMISHEKSDQMISLTKYFYNNWVFAFKDSIVVDTFMQCVVAEFPTSVWLSVF